VTLLFGGTAAVGVVSVRNQEGISGSFSDTKLQTQINHALLKHDKNLFDKIELCVKHGMVVVIGYVDDISQKDMAMQTIKNVGNYKEIFDEISVQPFPTASDLANDSSITSKIKSSLLIDSNVQSLNYDITTVKGIVYICGTAQSKFERDVVINSARTTFKVKKVVAYIKINKGEKK
jgi:osmotically-inducible protein OsmY